MGLYEFNSTIKAFTVALVGKKVSKQMLRSSKKMLGMPVRGRPRKKSAKQKR